MLSQGTLSKTALLDEAVAKARKVRDQSDGIILVGFGIYELFGEDGQLKQGGAFANLITTYGDEFYAKKGAAVAANTVTGMRLGTGSTAVAKSGAGAAIVTYTTSSQVALDATYPSAASKGGDTGWRISYQATWAAGVATASGLNEVVITNETPLTNVAGAAGNTLSRALLSPVVNKGASDTLTVTWYHDFLGA